MPIINLKSNQTDNPYCMPKCLSIVLARYGYEMSFKDFYTVTGQPVEKDGLNIDAAYFASKLGFRVDCFAYNFEFTSPHDAQTSQIELLGVLRKRLTEETFLDDKILSAVIRAMESGVNYHIEQPSWASLKNYLDQSIPIIVGVTRAALYGARGNPYEGHDIVLMSYKNRSVTFLDPMFPSEQIINVDTLMFAIMSRKIIAIDCYAVVVKK